PRVRVLRERSRVAAMEVARELVEPQHEREHRLGRGAPGLELSPRRLPVQLAEATAHLVVERGIFLEPLGARLPPAFLAAEPEVEDFLRRRQGHATCAQRYTSTETCTRVGMPARRAR